MAYERTSHGAKPGRAVTASEQLAFLVAIFVCAALVAYKFLVTTRLNISWDEFWQLHLLHLGARGELPFSLDSAHVWWFQWLASVGGQETNQVVAGRLAMVALLGLTTWLIWRTGRCWLSGLAAATPPLIYLSSIPVIAHGGALRVGSLLAPLLMGTMLALFAAPPRRKFTLLAGALFGVALSISVAAAWFAPLVIAAAIISDSEYPSRTTAASRTFARLATGVVVGWGGMVAVHFATSASSLAETNELLQAWTSRLAPTWLARTDRLGLYASWQPIAWAMIALGSVVSAATGRARQLALLLALLPALVYSGAYSDFYVVMLAPASLLAGTFMQWAISLTEPAGYTRWRPVIFFSVLVSLVYPFVDYMARPLRDRQQVQREVVAAVHDIFRTPVTYLDCCGMIASFPKANGFISTSGLAHYRAAGQPMMPGIIERTRPVFVLMNTPALSPGQPRRNGLLEPDRLLLQQLYPRYWGPIRIAGGSVDLHDDSVALLRTPFPGKYRLETSEPVLIDGVIRKNGDVLAVAAAVSVQRTRSTATSSETIAVRVFHAQAGPRPERKLQPQPIFSGL